MYNEHLSRKSPRLTGYGSSTCGAYFVTICAHNRRRVFGQICRDDPRGRPKSVLSPLGRIAADTLHTIAHKYDVIIDYCVIMPDHVHFILFLSEASPSRQTRTLGRIVDAYKSIVANQWLKICKQQGITMGTIWQERYYDHIIRNDEDLINTRAYIDTNPDRWILKYQNE